MEKVQVALEPAETILHDAVNKLISNVFESDTAREQLQTVFPSYSAAGDHRVAEEVLAEFTKEVQNNLKPTVDAWLADNNLAERLERVKTASCFNATLASNENTPSIINAPQLQNPEEAIVILKNSLHKKHLDEMTEALAEKERRRAQLQAEVRSELDQASMLCQRLGQHPASAPKT